MESKKFISIYKSLFKLPVWFTAEACQCDHHCYGYNVVCVIELFQIKSFIMFVKIIFMLCDDVCQDLSNVLDRIEFGSKSFGRGSHKS